MPSFVPDRLPHARIDYAAPRMIAALGEANRKIAVYDALFAESRSSNLLLAPLVRREAWLSSRIEGSQSTLSEVLLFDEGESRVVGERRDDLSEIVNYAVALTLGESEISRRAFSLNVLTTLHKRLLGYGSVRGQHRNPGAFRERLVWIGKPGAAIDEATYVPPEPLLVNELMENWANYYHTEQPDALVQAAILHAQFELIHPFEDGNGRLGRLLIPLFLWDKRVLARPNFYPSAYLEKNRDAYMHALKQLNASPGDWNGWVLFFLRAITEQANETAQTVRAIAALYEELKAHVLSLTHSQFAVPILDAIFELPIFKRRNLEKIIAQNSRVLPSEPTLHGVLTKLVEHKTLEVLSEGSGRRGTMYRLTRLMELLEA